MQFFQELMGNILSSEWQWGLIGINALMVSALLLLFKAKIGWVIGIDVNGELSVKDNPAFGTVLASTFLAYFIVMSGATSGGDVDVEYMSEILVMLQYGVSGMIMLMVSRFINDKMVMRNLSVSEELKKENMAVAIMDSGNTLATAMMIFAYMTWVQGYNLTTISLVFYGWIVSQVLLSLLSFIRFKIYKSNDNHTLYDAIKNGNVAVAIRNTCYRLAIASTPLIASMHVEFLEEDGLWQSTMILFYAIMLSLLILLISTLMRKILFMSVDFRDEINEQNNTGLAKVEGFIVIGVAIMLYGLLK